MYIQKVIMIILYCDRGSLKYILYQKQSWSEVCKYALLWES